MSIFIKRSFFHKFLFTFLFAFSAITLINAESTEQPPLNTSDNAVNENFRQIYYANDELRNLLTNNTSGQILVGQGEGNMPDWQSVVSNNEILQIQFFTISASSSSSVSGSDVRSNITGTITPSTNTSNIYVFMSSPVRIVGTSLSNGATSKLYRNNTTDLTPSVGFSNVTPQVSGQNFDGLFIVPFLRDSPNTTNATTYTMYWSQGSSSNSVTVMVGNQTATVVLIEVGQRAIP